MIIYISGPVTNDPDYRAKFAEAEKTIRGSGHDVINPAKVEYPDSVTHEQIMKVCMALVDMAEGIYMLDRWSSSKGSIMELHHFMDVSNRNLDKIFVSGSELPKNIAEEEA